MKKYFGSILFISGILIATVSCTKDELDHGFEHPKDVELSNDWLEDSLNVVQNEVWYRYSIGPEVGQVYVEWSEKDYHGPSRYYSADIIVDAYWLDGEAEYFISEDNGYGADAKLINVSSESGLLIRVRLKDNYEGNYGLKVYEKNSSAEIELIELNVGDDWYESTINEGETLGFLLKKGVADQEVSINWAEFNSPEEGYTADIKGSVYKLDQETAYLITDNAKNFVGKDKSHSDNPKTIILDQGETEFIVLISLNDPLKPGSFAIQIK
ncbi:MAG: hypothetical protein U9N86_10905 [Bacteroidota bacterium]|nr:hypothetical protein [Bacteroidota bacterium]